MKTSFVAAVAFAGFTAGTLGIAGDALATPAPINVEIRGTTAIVTPTDEQSSATMVDPQEGADPSQWAGRANVLFNQRSLGTTGASGAGQLQGDARGICLWEVHTTSPLDCGAYGDPLDFSAARVQAFYLTSHKLEDPTKFQWYDMGNPGTSAGGILLNAQPGWELAEMGRTSIGFIPVDEGLFFGFVNTRHAGVQSVVTQTPPSNHQLPVWDLQDSGIRFGGTVTVQNDQLKLSGLSGLPANAELFYLPAEGGPPGGETMAMTPGQFLNLRVGNIDSAARARGTFGARLSNGTVAWIGWDEGLVTIQNQGGAEWRREGSQIARQVSRR